VKERPIYGNWPRLETEFTSWKDVRPESRILPSNIGYLRFVLMSAEPEFVEGLIEAMGRFRPTDGLIIDLRTNGGGRRTPLKVLLPFFMAQDDPPRVVNVAAYRLGTKNIKENFKARYLYPVTSPKWSKAEREVIGRFAKTFKPEWMPPEGQFSPWHYFVISPVEDKRYYHYNKPVVILMDNGNFSACDIFLSGFKGLKNVILMGRPSGGGSGCTEEYRLHNSSIRIYLSRMASFQPSGKLYDGNGIQPDIAVEPIPTDFIGQSDTILEKATRVVREKIFPLHGHPRRLQ
jgi:C-terminal processing protease CtpA/Prc